MLANKDQYRSYFAEVSNYIKMSKILDEIGQDRSNFYRFQKSVEFDFLLSFEKLEGIYSHVQLVLKNLT